MPETPAPPVLIVVTGTPTSGFAFYGPFGSPEEATTYAENNLGEEWWVTNLINPREA